MKQAMFMLQLKLHKRDAKRRRKNNEKLCYETIC